MEAYDFREASRSAGIPSVEVTQQEFTRLLGYPRDWVLEGRAKELADWARGWFATRGRPWIYARQVESLEFQPGAAGGDTIQIDGVVFNSKRLRSAFEQAGAHSAILVAVGAGPEAEEEARRLWKEEKPDEYFFLEMYASAVVERLTTFAGARLCDWAEQRSMAVLPHSSPGYPDWDVAEQPRLLKLIRQTRSEQFPSCVDSFDSGMLRLRRSSRSSASRATGTACSGSPALFRARAAHSALASTGARPTNALPEPRPSRCPLPLRCSTPMPSTPSIAKPCNAGPRSAW